MLFSLFVIASLATSTLSSPSLVKRASPTCTPRSGSSDDVPAIVSAIAACPTGTIAIPKGSTYNIGSQLQFTGCSGCTFAIDGLLKVTTNFTYWNGKGQIFHLKNINGATIYSPANTGLIDGQGQASWDYIVNGDTSYNRPYMWRIDGSNNINMMNLTLKNAPKFHVVTSGNSKNIYYGSLTLNSASKSSNVAHNTDGFDIGPASYVTVENVHITNGDDCVVLKPGASYITARDITCVGSHGLSVGSLGGGSGANDIVTHSIFERATMIGSTKASGIKLYPGGSAHGSATVSNVTWKDIHCDGCQYALQIQSCYGEDAAYCNSYPSTAKLTGVAWKNITGVTDGSKGDVIGNLNCPKAGTCGISVASLSLKAQNGKSTVLCSNTQGSIGVTCTDGGSG